jgi:hypothetical protein
MGRKERRAYLEAIWGRYRVSDRRTKKQILDEFCAVCGYNRKYAIELLNKPLMRSLTAKRGRRPKYNTPSILEALLRIWKAADFMCSSRLKAVIPMWLPYYEQEYNPVDGETKRLLLAASAATLDRILRPIRTRYRKGLCGTKPGSLLREQIPIRTGFWDVERPGFVEADTGGALRQLLRRRLRLEPHYDRYFHRVDGMQGSVEQGRSGHRRANPRH